MVPASFHKSGSLSLQHYGEKLKGMLRENEDGDQWAMSAVAWEWEVVAWRPSH